MDLKILFLVVSILTSFSAEEEQINGSTPKEAASCKNQVADITCEFWRRHKACKSMPKRMFKYCKLTCHFCDGMCEDHLHMRCRWWVSHGACSLHRKRMEKMCPRSCRFCVQRSWGAAARSPPKCSATKYGCCWDGFKTAAGSHQEGCSECKDLRQFICKRFKPDCYQGSQNIQFMKRNCAKTCGICESVSQEILRLSYFKK